MGHGSSLVYKFLLVTPAIMMGVIGGVGRFRHNDYVFVTSGPEAEARVRAYVEPARLAEALVGDYRHPFTDAQLRAVAKVWREGYTSGKLKPLEPAFYEDTTREGVKSDAVILNCTLATYLLELADRELDQRNWQMSANDSLLAAESVLGVRYSDFASAIKTGIVQRRALGIISDALPHLSSAKATEMKKKLEALRFPMGVAEKMEKRAKFLFADYQQRKGDDSLIVESTEHVINLEDEMMRQAAVTKSPIKSTYLADRDATVPLFVSDVRIGINCATDINNRINRLESSK